METGFLLLRGVNVGGHNKLPMKELVVLLEGLGCEGARTYIQSGNAVFRTSRGVGPDLAADIAATIRDRFGFEPGVQLLAVSEMEAAARNNPFDTTVGKALHLFFTTVEPQAPDLEGLEALKSTTEEFLLKDGVFYLYAPDGIGRSKLAAQVEKKLGVPGTSRNWNTVSRLIALADEVTENG